MSGLAAMTVSEWIGLIGLIVFTSVLIGSLFKGHKSPPNRQ
jgi:hypothetical protein